MCQLFCPTIHGSRKCKFSLKTPLCCVSFAIASISVLEETGLCYQPPMYFAFTTYKVIHIWIPYFILVLGLQSLNNLLWLVDCIYIFWWGLSSSLKNNSAVSLSSPHPVSGYWDQSAEPCCRLSRKLLSMSQEGTAALCHKVWLRHNSQTFFHAQNFKHITGLHKKITVRSTTHFGVKYQHWLC